MSDNKDDTIEVQLKYFTIEDIKEKLENGNKSEIPAQISFMIEQFDALNSISGVTSEERDAQIGIAIYLWERSFDDGAIQILNFVKEVLDQDYKFDYDNTLPIIDSVYHPELTEEKFKPMLDEFIVTLTETIKKKIYDNIFGSELYKAIYGLPLEEDTIIGTEKVE